MTTGKYLVIVNPIAGNGKYLDRLDKIKTEFIERSISYDLHFTSEDRKADLLANSIKSISEKITPIEIRNFLSRIKNYQGASGVFSFDENRNPIKSIVILQFKDDKSIFIKTVSL